MFSSQLQTNKYAEANKSVLKKKGILKGSLTGYSALKAR